MRRRLVVSLAEATAWSALAVLAFFILARLYWPDARLVLIWVNAYTFWAYLPAYPVVAFALTLRRWFLLAGALAIVLFHLAWVLPDYRPAESIPAETKGAPSLRLMSANLYFGNTDFAPIAREVLEVQPDVLFVQEIGERSEEVFEAEGVSALLPYRLTAFENPYFGLAIYSRFPLEDTEAVEAGGRPLLRASITVGGHRVRLYHLHPTSPNPGWGVARSWNDGWRAILAELRDETGPVVVAGDFNMTQHHRWYRKLKALGFVSSHEERGRGSATTWPQTRALGQIRIDQVFHGEGVVSLSIREGRGHGSDHRPVIAELAILP